MAKSVLFETIDFDVLNTICIQNFDVDIENYDLLKGGMFNTTYSVELKNSAKYVLRFGPVCEEVLFPFEKHLGKAEIFVNELLQKNNIPANIVAASDFSRTVCGRDYMIFEYINGINLANLSLSKDARQKLDIKTGEIAKKIHSIKGDFFGRIANSFRDITFDNWNDSIQFEISEICKTCKDKKVLKDKTTNEIINIFAEYSYVFDNIESVLVHGDLWGGNLMTDCGQKEIIAVIDTDRAFFGDADIDLANPWIINDNFYKGYGQVEDTPNRKLKMLLYKLFYACIDTYVWKEEYSSKLAYIYHKKQVKKLLSQIKKAAR